MVKTKPRPERAGTISQPSGPRVVFPVCQELPSRAGSKTGEDSKSQTERRLWESARVQGMFVTGDGRVSPENVARLTGYQVSTLKQMRAEGRGPKSYPRGAGGRSKVSYFISELALWINRLIP